MGERLTGKVAIVTGAGTVPGPPDRPPVGNGRATAIVFAREGAAVVVADINLEAVEETKRMIEEEGGTCSVFRADVTRPQDCQAMAEHCLKTYGRIDILHNNVGTGRGTGRILEITEEDWDLVMNVNLKSMFHTCRAVLPQMLKQGSGVILNMSSVGAIIHELPELLLYAISKEGVNTLTRCLAFELADKGIRVNALMPGMIDTPMSYGKELLGVRGGDIERMRRYKNEKIPMKRQGEPWDVAYTALFLVSDETKYITGQILAVDGGLLLKGGGL